MTSPSEHRMAELNEKLEIAAAECPEMVEQIKGHVGAEWRGTFEVVRPAPERRLNRKQRRALWGSRKGMSFHEYVKRYPIRDGRVRVWGPPEIQGITAAFLAMQDLQRIVGVGL